MPKTTHELFYRLLYSLKNNGLDEVQIEDLEKFLYQEAIDGEYQCLFHHVELEDEKIDLTDSTLMMIIMHLCSERVQNNKIYLNLAKFANETVDENELIDNLAKKYLNYIKKNQNGSIDDDIFLYKY